MLESVDAGDLGQVPIVRRKFAQIIARVTEDAWTDSASVGPSLRVMIALQKSVVLTVESMVFAMVQQAQA